MKRVILVILVIKIKTNLTLAIKDFKTNNKKAIKCKRIIVFKI